MDFLSVKFTFKPTFLIPICILVGWSGMRSYGKEYITASLIREFLKRTPKQAFNINIGHQSKTKLLSIE